MDRNSVIVILVAIVIILTMLVPGLNSALRISILILGLLVILVTRRGVMYYNRGNKKIIGKKPEELPKALELYRKALKAGVPAEATITIGTILIYNKHLEEGKEAIQKVIDKGIKGKDNKYQIDARVAISMAYWQEGDIDKAISYCEDAYKMGGKSANLYVNLSTYYLYKEDVTSFLNICDEFSGDVQYDKSPALTDLKAVAEILTGKWKKASAILNDLLKSGNVKFADPYIHLIQVKLHFQNREDAIKLAGLILERCTFDHATVITEECVKSLIEELSTEQGALELMKANEVDPLALVNGKLPAHTTEEVVFTREKEPAALSEARFRRDAELNTEITEADEEWARKHGY